MPEAHTRAKVVEARWCVYSHSDRLHGFLAWRVLCLLLFLEGRHLRNNKRSSPVVPRQPNVATVATGGTACLFPTLCGHKADIAVICPCCACVCIIYESAIAPIKGTVVGPLWRWLKLESANLTENIIGSLIYHLIVLQKCLQNHSRIFTEG